MAFWSNFLKNKILITIIEEIQRLKAVIDLICEKIEIRTAIFEANSDPIKVINNTSVKILEENEERQRLIIQNVGTEPCFISLGTAASLNCFHFVLAADTQDKHGNGGSIELKNWNGSLYAICDKETKVSILEY